MQGFTPQKRLFCQVTLPGNKLRAPVRCFRVDFHWLFKRQELMAWPTPRFSKSEINKAGSILVSSNPPPEDHNWAQEVLTNWRACHGYPINTFQATLRQKLRHVDTNALVAQRLKRAPTIVDKLTRYPKMKLARMQDIGGLRAVMSTIEQVRKLESDYRNSRFKHKLVNSQDYLTHPKADGYRSSHLIYRYKNDPCLSG